MFICFDAAVLLGQHGTLHWGHKPRALEQCVNAQREKQLRDHVASTYNRCNSMCWLLLSDAYQLSSTHLAI